MFNMIPYRRAGRPSLFDDKFFRNFFDFSETASGFRVDVRDLGDKFVMEAELSGMK